MSTDQKRGGQKLREKNMNTHPKTSKCSIWCKNSLGSKQQGQQPLTYFLLLLSINRIKNSFHKHTEGICLELLEATGQWNNRKNQKKVSKRHYSENHVSRYVSRKTIKKIELNQVRCRLLLLHKSMYTLCSVRFEPAQPLSTF